MFKENDIVKDQNGVLGRIIDIDINNNGFEYGVLFMDVPFDGGLYWSTDKIIKEDCSSCIISIVETNSEEHKKFLAWEKEYNNLYIEWHEIIDKPHTHAQEIQAWELRPTQKQLEELYSNYQA